MDSQLVSSFSTIVSVLCEEDPRVLVRIILKSSLTLLPEFLAPNLRVRSHSVYIGNGSEVNPCPCCCPHIQVKANLRNMSLGFLCT